MKTICTVFGAGYFPKMPGTFASLLAIIPYLFWHTNQPIYTIFILIVLLLCIASCRNTEKLFGEKDPKQIVIDEVLGMSIALYMLPYHILHIALAFVIFRLSDIFKPAPIDKVESWPGWMGIVSDDIIAGFYANIFVRFIISVIPT